MDVQDLDRRHRITLTLIGLTLPLYALFNASFQGTDFIQVMRFYALPSLAVCAFVIFLGVRQAGGIAPLGDRLGKPVIIMLAVASILALITAFTTVWPEKSSTRTALKLLVLFYALALAFLLSTQWATARSLLMKTMLIGFLAYVGSLFLYLAINWGADSDWRYFGFSGHNIRSTALYATLGVLMGLGASATATDGQGERLPLANAIIGTIFVAWSGSRGVFAIIILCPIVSFVLVGKGLYWRLITRLTVTMAIALPLSLLIPVPDRRYGLLRTVNAHGEGVSRFDTGRIELWQLTWEYITRMPFFGYGDGLFFNTVTERHDEIYQPQPHNLPLEMIFSFGWLTAILILCLLATFLWRCIEACRRNEQLLPVTLPILAMAALSLAYAPLYDPISTLLLAMFGALALSWREDISAP